MFDEIQWAFNENKYFLDCVKPKNKAEKLQKFSEKVGSSSESTSKFL